MDDVARWSDADRADLFTVSGTASELTTTMVEKDFWVCWTLKRLFTLPDPPAGLLFKGGTSLSKVFGAIERFSEDVDLSFDRHALGFGDDKDFYGASGKQQGRQLDELGAACRDLVKSLLPRLGDAFGAALGRPPGANWSLRTADDDPDGQTVLFAYPRAAGTSRADDAYIRPVIRLEFGARSDHWPQVAGTVSPYAADEHPTAFREPTCTVVAMTAERTFWEKATILHRLHHRTDKPIADRQSRHYYDVVKLHECGICHRALQNVSLLADVVRHKRAFFREPGARYEDAVPGSLRLVPTDERLASLKQDYRKMQEMIFGPAPSFEELLDVLREIEREINRGH